MTRESAPRADATAAAERPRLAWFSPLPPARSGIAAYAAELLPRLADSHAIDAFVHETEKGLGESFSRNSDPEKDSRSPFSTFNAYEFQPRHLHAPYDLIVYQLGNASFHDYMWPYLVRYPGLLVLHDAQLHQSRARLLLQNGRDEHYRAEFRYNHPDARPGIAEYVAVGLGGPVHYYWPMLRIAVESSRLIAVHNGRLADELAEAFPGMAFETIAMGVADPQAAMAGDVAATRRTVRERHDVPEDAIVFAAFGLVTPEKRIPQVLQALASLGDVPAYLMLVGETAPHYDVMAEAQQCGVADRVRVTRYVPDGQLPAYLAAADVCLCLRWPSARESSASWLRCLAAARATVITDLADLVDVPALDPRTWSDTHGRAAAGAGAVTVAIDILDEDHSLRLAMRRLAVDAPLRAALGGAARRYWEQRHTLDHMRRDYDRVIDRARGVPPRAGGPALAPAHLRADGTERARDLLREVGAGVDFAREPQVR